jgi:hypothetical protein
MMTTTNLNEELNMVINRALGANLTVAQIIAALNAAVTNLTGKTFTHDRTVTDPGAPLNPSQP